jgi:aconitate decarboxylase
MLASSLPIDPAGATGQLCTWIHGVTLADVPLEIITRTKYLILDGLACGLVGAHLPWSETAVKAVMDMEPALAEGGSGLFGWEKVRFSVLEGWVYSTLPRNRVHISIFLPIWQRVSPLSAALLNSTFIQGFELDDWHSEAPLRSNSIVLPALFAAVDYLSRLDPTTKISGADFLLAAIVGFEVGPRVGLGLHGSHMLTLGWHSGAVFGPSAAAAAVSKLFGLSAGLIEDALGMACTQACGLMSAQFESEVKRMQHGFAVRNGLFAAILARSGYVGIKKIYEREYGGFLSTFGLGSGKEPRYRVDELAKELGTKWQTSSVLVKPYAAMAGTHCTVDCVRALQAKYPERMRDLLSIKSIYIEMGEAAFHHGGWKATRPLTATGAQMSNAFIAATQLMDGAVLPAQFRHDRLDRDDLWALVDKTTCVHSPEFCTRWAQAVTITFAGAGEEVLSQRIEFQRGVNPPLSNEEILNKWHLLTRDVMDDEVRLAKIEQVVVGLEACDNIEVLADLMLGKTKDPIA